MDTERMIRNLEKVEEDHKDDKVFTGQLNIADMVRDIRKRLEELKPYEDTDLTPQQIKDMQFCLREKSRECAELRKRIRELEEGGKDKDGWIPVNDRLPEIFGKYWATIRYDDGRISEPVVVDFRGAKQKYVVDTPNGREYETWGIDSAFHGSRVIAWRPYYIPDPYRPERSDGK